jgi:hypothetical protein
MRSLRACDKAPLNLQTESYKADFCLAALALLSHRPPLLDTTQPAEPGCPVLESTFLPLFNFSTALCPVGQSPGHLWASVPNISCRWLWMLHRLRPNVISHGAAASWLLLRKILFAFPVETHWRISMIFHACFHYVLLLYVHYNIQWHFFSVFRIDHTQVNEYLLSIHVFKIRSSTMGHMVNIKAYHRFSGWPHTHKVGKRKCHIVGDSWLSWLYWLS